MEINEIIDKLSQGADLPAREHICERMGELIEKSQLGEISLADMKDELTSLVLLIRTFIDTAQKEHDL